MKMTYHCACLTIALLMPWNSSHAEEPASAIALPRGRQSAVVKTESGKVSGVLLDMQSGLSVFRGIPYAAPPTNELRWRPPQPAPPWKGVRACTKTGPAAPQKPFRDDPTVQSEDCLFLNLWTKKAGAADDPLPVMVWIHGGGLNRGSGHRPMYDGAAFAQRDVVLVTINYRLGALGFLAHPALSAESADGVSGNYGFLDQIAALKWIKRNIANFGGDPSNVTVFGESAGGTSVSVLCTSPLASGLFHRAITQSPWMFGFVTKLAEPNFVELKKSVANTPSAEDLGIAWATVQLKEHSESGTEILNRLRSISPEQLLEKISYYPTRITIDDHVLRAHPTRIFSEGKQANIPMIIGTTKDEGNYFLNAIRINDRAEFIKKLANYYEVTAAQRLVKTYEGESAQELKKAGSRYVTDAWFVQPARKLLLGMNHVTSSAYQYEFVRSSRQYPQLGAPHAIELRYVFDTLEKPSAKDKLLAETMMRYWIEFARTGDPNSNGLPQWQEYTPTKRRYLKLGHEITDGSDLKSDRCDAIDRALMHLN